MATSFKKYRRDCFGVIRELLAHRGKATVDYYVLCAKNTKTEAQLSRLMTEVRNEI